MVDREADEKYHVDWEGKQLLNEDGKPIPIYVCICAAHSSYECCCGAWDVALPDEYEEQ